MIRKRSTQHADKVTQPRALGNAGGSRHCAPPEEGTRRSNRMRTPSAAALDPDALVGEEVLSMEVDCS